MKFLEQFEFDLSNHPGKTNVVADALIRQGSRSSSQSLPMREQMLALIREYRELESMPSLTLILRWMLAVVRRLLTSGL